MIPLKEREQITTLKILDNMGIPKTMYSNQGPEFKNNTFQKLLDKNSIKKHLLWAMHHL